MSDTWDEAGRVNAGFFDKGCENHGTTGWAAAHFMDADSQWATYHALASRLSLDNATLLDVGCGQGDLIPFLYQNKKNLKKYHGVDVSSKMVELATQKYGPDLFSNVNFLDPECSFEYDVVLAAGAWNVRVHKDDKEQFDYLTSAITKMYRTCKRGCAFTLLSSHGYEVAKDFSELACYEPWDVLKFCLQLTSAVVVDHASLPAEFAISMFHDD